MVPSLMVESVQVFAVRRQDHELREGLAAGGASVGAVTGMNEFVPRQIARLRKGRAAGSAGVGAVARMSANVLREGAGR